jgi:hypothetical protein
MQSANNARRDLGICTYADILNNIPNDVLNAKKLYLGYLCVHGEFDEISGFIRNTERELMLQILNDPYPIYNCGTILHILLDWNVGVEACRIFELLVEHGAEYYQFNGQLPWQRIPNHNYISPLTGEVLGYSNGEDEENQFLYTTYKLRNDLNLHIFEIPKDDI